MGPTIWQMKMLLILLFCPALVPPGRTDNVINVCPIIMTTHGKWLHDTS